MSVRFSAKCRKLNLLAAFFVFIGLSACGQIGPLYLPDQVDTTTEQNEMQPDQDGSAETLADEAKDTKNPEGF